MNAERGAPMRGECGEALRHGGSRHVGDDVELRSKNYEVERVKKKITQTGVSAACRRENNVHAQTDHLSV